MDFLNSLYTPTTCTLICAPYIGIWIICELKLNTGGMKFDNIVVVSLL